MNALRRAALPIGVACILVLVGQLLVVERYPDAPNQVLRVRADALQYLAMARGETEGLRAPFRYRVVAPWVASSLASLLPWTELVAFRVLSYAAIGVTYAISFVLSVRLGASRLAAALGLVLVFVMPWNLYVFHNPAMTDATAHAFIAAECWAVLAGATIPFAVLLVIGAGVRETTGALAPAMWAAGHRWQAALLTVLVIAAFLVVRSSAAPVQNLGGSVIDSLTPRALAAVAKECVVAWGGLWLIAPFALWRVRSASGPRVRTILVMLLLAGVVSALAAADAGRMMGILLVPFALGAALAIDALIRRGRTARVGVVIAAALPTAVAWMPNRILPLDGAVFTSSALRIGALTLSVASGVVALLALRTTPRQSGSDA